MSIGSGSDEDQLDFNICVVPLSSVASSIACPQTVNEACDLQGGVSYAFADADAPWLENGGGDDEAKVIYIQSTSGSQFAIGNVKFKCSNTDWNAIMLIVYIVCSVIGCCCCCCCIGLVVYMMS